MTLKHWRERGGGGGERNEKARRSGTGTVTLRSPPLLPFPKPCFNVDSSKTPTDGSSRGCQGLAPAGARLPLPADGPGASFPPRLLPETHTSPCGGIFAAPRHGPARRWGPPGGTSPGPSTRHKVLSDLGSPGSVSEGFMLFPTRLWQPEPLSPSRCHYPESKRCLHKIPPLGSLHRSSPGLGQGTTRSQERETPEVNPSL